jgi:hypothetical protein
MIDSRRWLGLQELFSNCNDTLYLRGSYARGDKFSNDIDISAYNEGGLIKMKNPPTEFDGLRINYGGIAIKDLEDYFALCPRGASSMMEMLPISIAHPEVPNMLACQKSKFLSNHIAEYSLFLLTEEETNGRVVDRDIGDDYFALKRRRGSKRTISRMIWGTKARDFQALAGLSHEDVLVRMATDYSLPINVADSCTFVLRSAHLNPNAAVWMKHVVNIEAWYKSTYAPSVISYLHKYITDDVVKYCILAAKEKADTQDLLNAYALSKQLTGQQKWVLLFALSGNWELPSKCLVDIWREFRHQIAYRNIIRNLIANISAPDNLINPSEFSHDKLMTRAYHLRRSFK